MARDNGRRFTPTLVATADGQENATRIVAPQPGYFRNAPAIGTRVRPGSAIGELEVLGTLHTLLAPASASGTVIDTADSSRPESETLARRPVDAASTLMMLGEADDSLDETVKGPGAQPSGSSSGPVFRTTIGGRYYARPAPDQAPFVEAGQVLEGGETVALVEVMKTFNRIQLDDPLLALPVRIARIVVKDGDDIEAGDVLLELEDAR